MRSFHRSPLLLLPVALVASAALGACGGDDAAPVAAADLDGTSYTVTSIEDATIVDGTEIVISFEDGMILVEAGCNSQRGGYEIEDGTLVVGGLAATMMACDEALMDQDQLMAGIVSAGPTIELDGSELVLTTDVTSVTATKRA